MNFDELDALGRDILEDAYRGDPTAHESSEDDEIVDDIDDIDPFEMNNSFVTANNSTVPLAASPESNPTSPRDLAPAPTSISRMSPASQPITSITDNCGDTVVLEETLAVLEAVVPVTDRRLYTVLSSLKESRFPTRTNSASLSTLGSNGSLTSPPARREDLLKRLFRDDLLPSDAVQSNAAVLLRDLLVEELKNCSRLQTLQHTVIEPLETQISDGRCNWMTSRDHHTIFHHFSLVSSAQFDHCCALAKMMRAEWPNTAGIAPIFQKWVFSIPLFADLANTLSYSTQRLVEIQQHPLSKREFKEFMAAREEDPKLIGKASVFMPITDLINEPFNHLPKYQFFIESLLSCHYKSTFENGTDGENSSASPSIKTDTLAGWCQSLAILQQSLNYLTKCYHQSENMGKLHKFIDRLGSEAPGSLRHFEQRKIYGGHDTLVYITDHRRKRRKRGFVVVLSDCLLLVRCADISSSQSSSSALVTPSDAGHMSSGSTVQSAIVGNRRSMLKNRESMASASALPPASLPSPQAASTSESKAMKKERERREKKEKKAEKERQKLQKTGSVGSASTSPAVGPSTTTNTAGTATTATSTPTTQTSSPQNAKFTSATTVRPAQGARAVGGSVSGSPVVADLGAPKKSASSLLGGISRSIAQTCALRFIALLMFDGLAFHTDSPLDGSLAEGNAITLWAFDTKFTIEFEQPDHKQKWLEMLLRHMTKISPRPGPLGKPLAELYCHPSRGIPSSSEKQDILDAFLYDATRNFGPVKNMVPPFLQWLLDQLTSSGNRSKITGDMIINASVPPRNNAQWKALKKNLLLDWAQVDLSQYPRGFVLALLCEFLAKMADPLIPTSVVDLIATQWNEEDCSDPLRIKRLTRQLPVFKQYALGYIAISLHQLTSGPGEHRCTFANNRSSGNGNPSQPSSESDIATSTPSSTTNSLPAVAKSPSLNNIAVSGKRQRASRDKSTQMPPRMSIVLTGAPAIPSVGDTLTPMLEDDDNEEPEDQVPRVSGGSTSSSDLQIRNSLAVPTISRSDSSNSVPGEEKMACDATPLALLLSGALAPSIVRPFKLRSGKPVAVGNFIGRLPKLVLFFASLIDHAPGIFSFLSRVSPDDFLGSFSILKASLAPPRATFSVFRETVLDGDFAASSSSDVSGSPSDPASSVASETVKRSNREARKAAIFNFDMSGMVTESFSVMDFSSLHFALAPTEL